MKIKYKYRSPLFYVLFYGSIVLMILLAYSGVKLREEDAGIILISIAVYIVLLIILSVVPVSMHARKRSVLIKVFFKKTRIRYRDISEISVEQEFQTAMIRGDQDHYNEILTIETKYGKRYIYRRRLDINYKNLIHHPCDLKRDFNDSKFSQLKTYIEDMIKTT